MKVTDFDYFLPEELIAQHPLAKRDASRLMVLNRAEKTVTHKLFTDLADYLVPGDLLVFNDTKVIPARLLGQKEETGAKAELLLLRDLGADVWECLVKPGKKLKPGSRVVFGRGELIGEIKDFTESGGRLVHFVYQGIFNEVLELLGQMPLPPYITEKLEDQTRYQTVYARERGSAAAPTAGLHFTRELMQDLKNRGINEAFVTLHVGLGTFRPVKAEEITEHKMHAEYYHLSQETADLIRQTKASGKRVIAVGTTSTRVLESAAVNGGLQEQSGWTDIFIYPGIPFRVIDGLITNFHLPKSTLLMLVSALADREFILEAYREAVQQKYRFFSFGDAMLLL